MKSFLLFIALLFAVALSSTAPTVSKAASVAKKQRAVVQFTQPVQLLGLTLKGQYLFIHDDAAMARGEECTFIYKGNADIPKKLVVAFHCTPAARDKVDNFSTRAVLNSSGQFELREFQFAGSSEAHLVPQNHDAHMSIASQD